MHYTATLKRLLRTIPLIPLDEVLFRTVRADTLYGFSKAGPYNPRPLYSLGPSRDGARYTPKGGAPSLYLAGDMETSMREYFRIPWPKPLRPPHPAEVIVTYSASVSLHAVLDLTNSSIRRKLGTNKKEIAEPWRYRRDGRKPPTQRLGAVAAKKDGRIQAILFPSTMGPDNCLAIFTNSIKPPTYVEIMDPDGKLLGRIP